MAVQIVHHASGRLGAARRQAQAEGPDLAAMDSSAARSRAASASASPDAVTGAEGGSAVAGHSLAVVESSDPPPSLRSLCASCISVRRVTSSSVESVSVVMTSTYHNYSGSRNDGNGRAADVHAGQHPAWYRTPPENECGLSAAPMA